MRTPQARPGWRGLLEKSGDEGQKTTSGELCARLSTLPQSPHPPKTGFGRPPGPPLGGARRVLGRAGGAEQGGHGGGRCGARHHCRLWLGRGRQGRHRRPDALLGEQGVRQAPEERGQGPQPPPEERELFFSVAARGCRSAASCSSSPPHPRIGASNAAIRYHTHSTRRTARPRSRSTRRSTARTSGLPTTPRPACCAAPTACRT